MAGARLVTLTVIGATGQLGCELATALQPLGELQLIGHADLEIADANAVEAVISASKPDVVFNCAAFHKTDLCEVEPDRAFLLNAIAVRDIADSCARHAAIFVHFSSDYVFDGLKGDRYVETDPTSPVNTYGASKLAGEYLAFARCDRTYVFRGASLFGGGGSKQKGGNFVDGMLRRAAAGETLRVVDDIVMSPTATADAAIAVAEAIRRGLPFGRYHLVNDGACSWCAFAREIVRAGGYDLPVEATRSDAAPQAIRRPPNSSLEARALAQHGITLPPWQDAVGRYIRERTGA